MTDTWEEERDHEPDEDRLEYTVKHLIDVLHEAPENSAEYKAAIEQLDKLLAGPRKVEAGVIAEEYQSLLRKLPSE